MANIIGISNITGITRIKFDDNAPVQIIQLNFGDIYQNTPIVSTWDRWCYNEANPKTNILNTLGLNSGISAQWDVQPGSGESDGQTVTSSGYPSSITQYGTTSASTKTVTFSGLNNTHHYTFDFYACTDRDFENTSITTFNIIASGEYNSVVFNPVYPYTGPAQGIALISPVNNTIGVTVSHSGGGSYWYLNSIVITEFSE